MIRPPAIRCSEAKGRSAPLTTDGDIVCGTIGTSLNTVPRGVIFCHGAGDKYIDPHRDQRDLLHRLARYATVITADLGGEQTWAGDLAMQRIGQAVAYLRARGVVGPIALIGMSMGNANALAYALRNPSDVLCVAGVIPLIDIQDFINVMGTQSFIDPVYPGVPVVDYRWAGTPQASASEKVVDGAVQLRNLWPDPRGTRLDASWSSGQLGTKSIVTDMPRVGTGYRNSRGASTTAQRIIDFTVPEYEASTGYAVKMTVRLSHALASAQVRYRPAVGTGTNQVEVFNGALAAGVTQLTLHGVTASAAPTATAGFCITTNTNLPDGFTVDVSEIVLVKTATPIPDLAFFDGDTPDVMSGYRDNVDGLTRSPIKFATDLPPALPVRLWYAGDDPYTRPATVEAFKALRPQTVITNVGNYNHTDTAVAYAAIQAVPWILDMWGIVPEV